MISLQKISQMQKLLLFLLILVLLSNILLYRSPLENLLHAANTKGVVIGSLVDLAIVAPLLFLTITRKKGFTVKRFITWMVAGIVIARFLIPATYFEPYKYVPFFAIGIELFIVLAEVGLLILLVYHLPKIVRTVKLQKLGPLFTLHSIVEKQVRNHPIINIFTAELLMFYYAFASWKKSVPTGKNYFSLHQKSNLIAFYIMLIPAIVIETIGIHWLLHGKSLVLSIVLLLINIYTVIYFIADIQCIRLNPLYVDNERIYVSLGLGKRMVIPFEDIIQIKWGKDASEEKLNQKTTIDFIAKDFEAAPPHCIIELKKSKSATLLFGMKKNYSKVAIRLDDPARFKAQLEKHML